ncbi:TetR/AcrR family transcriptional regulator [Streptomyces radicis]|nr:TetR/AcrR family transcriptional regulator [Streptomyces radicis]
MRSDARRNRERLLDSAARLFAARGRDVQMEEIAADANVGLGTLYRNFASKQDLFVEIVRRRYLGLIDLAERAESIDDPAAAFRAVFVGYLEQAECDSAFQLALLGGSDLRWEGVEEQKALFAERVRRIIERGVRAGVLRGDLTFGDFPALVCGVMSTMYFKPSPTSDWRRHLDLVLTALETAVPQGAER